MFNPNAIGVGAHADGVAVKHLTLGRAKYNVWKTLLAVALDAPPSVTDLNPTVPDAVSEFVAKLLSKDPRKRPDSAESVVVTLADLESQLAQGKLRPRRLRWLRRSLIAALVLVVIAFVISQRFRSDDKSLNGDPTGSASDRTGSPLAPDPSQVGKKRTNSRTLGSRTDWTAGNSPLMRTRKKPCRQRPNTEPGRALWN